MKLKLNKIVANENQPRKYFNEETLQELANSIIVDGLQEPILVRPLNDKYEIVQGERRFRAHEIANLEEIDVRIKELSTEDAFHLSVIENIQREQMTAIEEAQAFQRYIEMGYTHEKIAEKVSKGRTYVTSRLRLLNLMPELQDWIAEGRISEGHVKQLLKYEAILSKHIKRENSSESVQILFFDYFNNSERISVKDVMDWGELMRGHFLNAIIGTFNGRGELKLWNKHRSIKSFCGDYHLHIDTVSKEDIDYLTEMAIKEAPKDQKKSKIHAVYEELEEFLFDPSNDKNEIWDSRGVVNLGNETLEELENNLKNYMKIMEGAKESITKAYYEASEMDSTETGRNAAHKEAERIESMDVLEYMDEYFFKENVSRDTIQ